MIKIKIEIIKNFLIQNIFKITVYSRGETYAIIYDGKIVGCIGLIFYPEFRNIWGKDAAQIGYWIGEEYHLQLHRRLI